MGQFRSYNQKPYIYFNKLVQMFQEILPKISDYTLKLDPDWFNSNNPYWYRLCYMLDYIQNDGLDNTNMTETVIFDNTETYQLTQTDNTYTYQTDLLPMENSKIQPFNITISASTDEIPGQRPRLALGNESVIQLDIYNDADISKTIYFVREYTNIDSSYFDGNDVYYITEKSVFDGTTTTLDITCSIPPIVLYGIDLLRLKFTIYNTTGGKTFFLGYFNEFNEYRGKLINPSIVQMNSDTKIITRTYDNDLIQISLKSLYKKENPLFEIVLQYTKMMGLVWDIDYINQEVWIKTKNNYFKDYTITDWSHKLDRTNEFTIASPVFDSNSVKFNYEENDGYRYSNYNERYSVRYGEKILYPEYEFNTETKELFNGIPQSMVSSRTHRDFYKIYQWSLDGFIEQNTTKNTIIEDADKEDSSSANINGWYFRCKNISIPVTTLTFITDDSSYQIGKGQKCYYSLNAFYNSDFEDYIQQVSIMPKFSVVYDGYGCIFNKPMEDYTYTGEVANTNNYIYDIQWDSYINERYNIQNKKLNTYFDLNMLDIHDFKYSNFVTVSNQLFIVNKIQDFKLESPTLTKVELETITDVESYQSGATFPFMYSPTPEIIVDCSDVTGTSTLKQFTVVVYTDDKPYAVEFSSGVLAIGISTKYNDRTSYVMIVSTSMNNSTEIINSTITFRNYYGQYTIPVTIIGGNAISQV